MGLPYLIGIAGASCSGKTTIADLLSEKLDPAQTVQIGLDSYYRDLAHLSPQAIGAYNLDEPEALDRAALFEQVAALAQGRAIDKPVYDYKTHTRAEAPERIEPKRFIIIEGLFALYWEEVRRHLATRVFIDAPHDVCLERRIARDRSHRGRTPDEVRRRYRRTVGPMFDTHVLPTREFANAIVSGTDPPARSVETILGHIHEQRKDAG